MLASSWLTWTLTPLPACAQSSNIALTITPASENLLFTDSLNVTLNVTGGEAGNFTVASYGFTSLPVQSTTGTANITIPPGVLQLGNPDLNASFVSESGTISVNSSIAVVVSPNYEPVVDTIANVNLTTGGSPFAALPYDGGLLVTVQGGGENGTGILVYTGSNPSDLTLHCVQAVGGSLPLGMTRTPNGDGLVVAMDTGIALLNFEATIANCSSPFALVPQGQGAGTFDSAVSPNSQFAAVANEYGQVSHDANGTAIDGNIGIVSLTYDAASGVPINGTTIGQIATGASTIPGVTISHDGRRIYVTSEVSVDGAAVSGTNNSILNHGVVCHQGSAQNMTFGVLTVIDAELALKSPGSEAILATVAAGCSPVRVVETTDGEVLWVAARGDNKILAFSVGALLQDPDNALIGDTSTGIAPVGLQLFAQDRLLAVANSNRFAADNSSAQSVSSMLEPLHRCWSRRWAGTCFPAK